MSGSMAGVPGGKGRGKAEAPPIDLDMTPMMNMLIILISFLVTMVVFTHLAVIKFELPSSGGQTAAAGGSEDSSRAPETDLTLVISEGGFQILGEGRKHDPLPRTREGYDFTGLGKALVELRAEFPTAHTLVLLIGAEILYEDIVATMDVCRDHNFPDVLLSGGLES